MLFLSINKQHHSTKGNESSRDDEMQYLNIGAECFSMELIENKAHQAIDNTVTDSCHHLHSIRA